MCPARIPWLLLSALSAQSALFAVQSPTLRHVEVLGNSRIPAATILHHIGAKPGTVFSLKAIEDDVRKLHTLGLFRTIEVRRQEVDESEIDLFFRVEELPFVSGFDVRARDEALREQVHDFLRREKMELAAAAPLRPAAAHRAAVAIRSYLRSQRHPNAQVRVREDAKGGAVRVVFEVDPGPKLKVGRIVFTGNHAITSDEMQNRMELTRRPAFWEILSRTGTYAPEDLQADLEDVRKLYHSRGFAAAQLGMPRVETREFVERSPWSFYLASRKRQKIEIRVPITEGPRYRLASLRRTGDAGDAERLVSELFRDIAVPDTYDQEKLQSLRSGIERALGRKGYALARVRLDLTTIPETLAVHASFDIDAGSVMAVRRILFEGNSRIPEKFLRREMVAREGETYDVARIDDSVAHLNRGRLVQEVGRDDVTLRPTGDGNSVDVLVKVREKDRQGIYGTGGLAGGGYLGILYTAFNLVGLGESWSLELDGGASRSNFLLNMVGRRFLGSPFTLGLSGFHRVTRLNVASLVPGHEDVLSLFRHRSTGGGVSGSYAVTPHVQVGLGFELRKDVISILDAEEAEAEDSTAAGKSLLSPSFVLDTTRSDPKGSRGVRIAGSHSWIGSAFLKDLEATRQSAEFTRMVPDPWTGGRNTLAFHLVAGRVRPTGGRPLGVTKRFFAGEEIVRGFPEGGLSPWTVQWSAEGPKIAPSGADTLWGASAEYRARIRGPLTSVVFADLGWTMIDSKRLESSAGNRVRLIDATNGVLRASLGGELRMQLPVIREPARLIFAWNPLRLEHWLESPRSGALRLADPRKAVRFALGAW